MQKAAEYRALCYQAFNTARLQLDADLDKKNVKRFPKVERKMPRAIIVDIDEPFSIIRRHRPRHQY
jgi:predicted secreted acid phosphatase